MAEDDESSHVHAVPNPGRAHDAHHDDSHHGETHHGDAHHDSVATLPLTAGGGAEGEDPPGLERALALLAAVQTTLEATPSALRYPGGMVNVSWSIQRPTDPAARGMRFYLEEEGNQIGIGDTGMRATRALYGGARTYRLVGKLQAMGRTLEQYYETVTVSIDAPPVQSYEVRLSLDNLHCYRGADFGDAEPYLWVIFFAVDAGGPRVIATTDGSKGALGDSDVGDGDDVPIPPQLGMFRTELRPLELGDDAQAVAGGVVVLLEDDGTPADVMKAGFETLYLGIVDELDEIVKTALVDGTLPPPEDLVTAFDRLSKAVIDKIEGMVSPFDFVANGLNADDRIGVWFFYYPWDRLAAAGPGGIRLSQRFQTGAIGTGPSAIQPDVGDWEIRGRAGARPSSSIPEPNDPGLDARD